jgi:hypothetical protein
LASVRCLTVACVSDTVRVFQSYIHHRQGVSLTFRVFPRYISHRRGVFCLRQGVPELYLSPSGCFSHRQGFPGYIPQGDSVTVRVSRAISLTVSMIPSPSVTVMVFPRYISPSVPHWGAGATLFHAGKSYLACGPLACSPLACSPLACSPLACSPQHAALWHAALWHAALWRAALRHAAHGVQPSGMQPSGMPPSGMQPSGMQPSGMQPSGMQPSGVRPSGIQPSGMQPSGMPPTACSPLACSPHKAFATQGNSLPHGAVFTSQGSRHTGQLFATQSSLHLTRQSPHRATLCHPGAVFGSLGVWCHTGHCHPGHSLAHSLLGDQTVHGALPALDELEEHVDPLLLGLLHVAVDDQAGDVVGELLPRPPDDPLGAGSSIHTWPLFCHTRQSWLPGPSLPHRAFFSMLGHWCHTGHCHPGQS